MDNITEIKTQLDNYYKEYKDNKNSLSSGKTKAAAKLIMDINFAKDGGSNDAADELARFSADVVRVYFEDLSSSGKAALETTDEILKNFLAADKDASKSQYFVQKFVFAVTAVMKNYKDEALNSKQLPHIVVFIARFAVRSNKYKNKFQTLVNSTAGRIFMLNYSDIKKNLLVNIWKTANDLYPEMSGSDYGDIITEWGKKYGFVQKNVCKTNADHDTKKSDLTEERTTVADNVQLGEIIAKKLYNSLKRDMDNEKQQIITALSEMIMPVSKTLEKIRNESDKNSAANSENFLLKAKTADLEKRLSEQNEELRKLNQILTAAKTENDELKKTVSSLEEHCTELDGKLNDAYAINSRESSLEAEKIRSELKKAFVFLYEDWLEYEVSDVNEENYESLQAIIKKIFRSLDRVGIDFKGNN